MAPKNIPQPRLTRFLFSDTRMAWLWLLVRLYVGWVWITAGWDKVNNPSWVGENAGTAIGGFVRGALTKTGGAHPDVQGWYAAFMEGVVLPNAGLWSVVIAYGELLVGAALIVGFLTGIAAFFGSFMNINFLLAGAVSTNPVLLILSIGLILAWRIAGHIGLDYCVLTKLSTPWKSGKLFSKST